MPGPSEGAFAPNREDAIMKPHWRELESEMIKALQEWCQLTIPKAGGDQQSLGSVNISALARALADRVIVKGGIVNVKADPFRSDGAGASALRGSAADQAQRRWRWHR
jgi:hypothetical protein